MLLAVDLQENFVQVPAPFAGPHAGHSTLSDLGSKQWREPVPPELRCFVADIDAALYEVSIPEDARMSNQSDHPLAGAHGGTYRVETRNGRVHALHGFEEDPDPSPIGAGVVDALSGPMRITTPMIRESWLRDGPGAATEERRADAFVAVSWAEAEQLVAKELTRVREEFGNQAVCGGSYGWVNTGRFHHAQSQLHRFLNCIGGYTRSADNYSFAAGELIPPHVLGSFAGFMHDQTSWSSVIGATRLTVALGGMPPSATARSALAASVGTGRAKPLIRRKPPASNS